mmetsp:Transcript_48228/g.114692  ORF Transcript_48228/g.114692 Transcript_48228/m.114692 type:complete len:289 (-) Transcript_48228:2031-2897(-)
MTVRALPILVGHAPLDIEGCADRISSSKNESIIRRHLVNVDSEALWRATFSSHVPTNVAASSCHPRALGQSQVLVTILMSEVIELPHQCFIRQSWRVARAHALVYVQRDDCPVAIRGAHPETPVILPHAVVIQLPPCVGPAVGLPILVIRTNDCTSFVPTRARTIDINHVGALPGASRERTLGTIVAAGVWVEGIARNPIVMVEAVGIRRVLKREAGLAEHSLRPVRVAASQIANTNISRAIKVPEGHTGQDGLHVSVVELEACCGVMDWGAVPSVGSDHSLPHGGGT